MDFNQKKAIQFNYKKQRWPLILVLVFFSNTLYAQVSLNIEIRGVNEEIEKNIREYLSIEQQKEHHADSTTIPVLERFEGDGVAKIRESSGFYGIEEGVWRDELMRF